MLTREDLQAIADIMDEKIQASEQRTDEKLQAMEQRTDEKLRAMEQRIATNTAQFVREEIQAAEQRIMQGAAALMDAEFTKHFKLLSEQQDRVLSGLADEDDLSIIDGRLDDLETTVKRHSAEITKLKKAQ